MSFDIILPFLRPLKPLLGDDQISEIMVNPDGSAWVEREGLVSAAAARFARGELGAALEVIASKFGKQLDADHPILSTRLADGSRLAAMIPPVVGPEPLLNIRRFPQVQLTLEDLIARGTLTENEADQLRSSVHQRKNILISGSTGAGKTTLAAALASEIPDQDRIVVIEDTRELRIAKPHLVLLEAQSSTHKAAVSFDELLRAALRHRPDRLLVGEVRGLEALVLLDAMNTGHPGMLATIHATSAGGALVRLANLAARADTRRMELIEREVRSSIDLVVHMERREGIRRVAEILTVQKLMLKHGGRFEFAAHGE